MSNAVKQMASSQSSATDGTPDIQTLRRRFKSPLRYPGGKQKALDRIWEIFPRNAAEYREPLVGGGSVYLQARAASFAGSYWINDRFKELTSFWKCVQDPVICKKLMKELEALRAGFKSAAEIKR